jgi:serine/threonine protein kinase
MITANCLENRRLNHHRITMKHIGKYRIRALLGRGGMGKVFKVEHPTIGKIAALKLLDPDPLLADLLGMDRIRKLFLSEAVTLAGLRHPNIVEILDYDDQGPKPFYLMEFYVNNLGVMIGESSHPDRPSRRIAVDKAIHYIRQTLQGLHALHHGGIVHRDIKPHNLLITDEDTVKICDFGLSKLRGETFSGPAGLKVGSAWYAPPEQEADPDSVDFSADLYSLGVVLHRMLTGTLPQPGGAAPSALNADLDTAWDRFIGTALAVRSADRFSSAKQMLAELDDLQARWEGKKQQICRLPTIDIEQGTRSPGRPQPRPALRRDCVKVDPRRARTLFGLDELWRPKQFFSATNVGVEGSTVSDAATGLTWQLSGSEIPMDWHRAGEYVQGLNTARWGGSRQWRLPTIDELATLLTEAPQGAGHCIQPVFDPTQRWLWSCDRRSFTAAWYVSVDLGFVAWQDFSARYYVRAVHT